METFRCNNMFGVDFKTNKCELGKVAKKNIGNSITHKLEMGYGVIGLTT